MVTERKGPKILNSFFNVISITFKPMTELRKLVDQLNFEYCAISVGLDVMCPMHFFPEPLKAEK